MTKEQWANVVDHARGIVEARGEAANIGPVLEEIRQLVDPIDAAAIDAARAEAAATQKQEEIAALEARLTVLKDR